MASNWFAPATTLVLVVATASFAVGREPANGSEGLRGWVSVTLPTARPAFFRALHGGGIAVTAKSGFGLIYMPVKVADARKMRLSWRWRIDAAPGPTDLRARGGDDRPLAVHVWFSTDRKLRSPPSIFKRLGRRVVGLPASGAVLTYVWGGKSRRGTMMKNPYLNKRGALIVLRSGTAAKGRWTKEMIDVAADFRRAFGRTPPPIAFIAISADTDNKGGVSRARITKIRFSAQ